MNFCFYFSQITTKMINELDLRSLWKELDDYVIGLDKESKDLQDVWVKIAQIKSKNENEAAE